MTPNTAGIIGLGIMGRRMLEHMARHDRFQPGLLWDPSPQACRAAQALVPEARTAAGADEVIDGSDVVYLACPPGPRKAYALAAAAAGKPVFLEKPLGVDVAESRDLVQRLANLGVPAVVNFTQAAGQALATVASDSTMGTPRGIDIVVTYANWPRDWQIEADWLRLAAEGGATREVISHFLFFSGRVLGPVRLVWAQAMDLSICAANIPMRLPR